MGKIISTRRKSNSNKIIFEIEVDQSESIALQGHYDDVYLFSDNITTTVTHISSRGKDSKTKYFLVPKHYKGVINRKAAVTGQTIETNDKVIFVYVAKLKKGKK